MKRSTRILLAVSLLINAGFASYYLTKKLIWTDFDFVDKTTDNYNTARISIYKNMNVDTGDIVFLGTSLTEQFPLAESFPGLPVRNRGISGNTTAQILDRVNMITTAHPRLIILEAGINDFLQKIPLDTVFTNYSLIVERIQTESPKTQLILQTVLPTNWGSNQLNPEIESFNKTIRSFAEVKHLRLIDLYSDFLKDGHLNPDLTFDGIHLNGNGYKIWVAALKRILPGVTNYLQ